MKNKPKTKGDEDTRPLSYYDYIKEEYILKHSCIDLYSLPQVKTINHNDISSKNCKNYVYSAREGTNL